MKFFNCTKLKIIWSRYLIDIFKFMQNLFYYSSNYYKEYILPVGNKTAIFSFLYSRIKFQKYLKHKLWNENLSILLNSIEIENL